MKKIGVISLYNGSYNYGGVLQAYALCKLIDEIGYDATQICYSRTKKLTNKIQQIRAKKIKFLIKRALEKIETKVCDKFLDQQLFQKRRNAFEFFKENNIKATKRVYNIQTINELVNEYDAFVCGSDQVWNPNLIDEGYLLQFVPNNKVKFSYAASVAAPIRKEMYPIYHDALQRLDGISVRENNIQNELRKISGKPVEWVLDPTLLIKQEAWEEVMSSVEMDAPYILCYFLGADKKMRYLAKAYAEKMKYKIVTLPYLGNVHKIYDKKFGNIQKYEVGPDTFLGLIKNAECIFTDSFHAVSFAHIFHKPFFAAKRTGYEKGENRIVSLLELSGLEERYLELNDKDLLDRILKMPSPDYIKVEKNLQDKKRSSLKYLYSCLERIKEN